MADVADEAVVEVEPEEEDGVRLLWEDEAVAVVVLAATALLLVATVAGFLVILFSPREDVPTPFGMGRTT